MDTAAAGYQPWHFYALTCAVISARCGVYLLLGKKLHDSNKHTVPRALVPSHLLQLFGTRGRPLIGG